MRADAEKYTKASCVKEPLMRSMISLTANFTFRWKKITKEISLYNISDLQETAEQLNLDEPRYN